jgi:hypothetical protein
MPAATTGLKPILFGDLSAFIRREVEGSYVVKTFHERYAEFAQVGYEAFWRIDGALAKGATIVPVMYLTMAKRVSVAENCLPSSAGDSEATSEGVRDFQSGARVPSTFLPHAFVLRDSSF